MWNTPGSFIANIDELFYRLADQGHPMRNITQILSQYIAIENFALSQKSKEVLRQFRMVLASDEHGCFFVDRRIKALVTFLVKEQPADGLQSAAEASQWVESRLQSAYMTYQYQFIIEEAKRQADREKLLALEARERQAQLCR